MKGMGACECSKKFGKLHHRDKGRPYREKGDWAERQRAGYPISLLCMQLVLSLEPGPGRPKFGGKFGCLNQGPAI